MEKSGSRGGNKENAGEDLMVGTAGMGKTGSLWSDRNRREKGVRDMGDLQVDGGPHGNVGWRGNWV